MANQASLYGGMAVAQVLAHHGVSVVFTLCGGHISPILTGAKSLGIRVVDVRNEATAVFAADAMARLTGIPGIAAVTAGPGLTNTITAIKNAQLAEVPLVVLAGATATILKGRGALQDIDQRAIVKSCVKWAATVKTVRDIIPTLEQALAIARSDVPGPVVIEYPVDVLYPEADVRAMYGTKQGTGKGKLPLRLKLLNLYLERHLNHLFAGLATLPAIETLPVSLPKITTTQAESGCRLLRQSQKPLILLGSQALLNPSQLSQLQATLELLRVPVYLSGMARGLLGRSHPLQMRHTRKEALREADLIILAGVACDFRLDYGRQIPTAARLITVNRNPATLKKNCRPHLAILGEPELLLQKLAAQLGYHQSDWLTWTDHLRARDEQREREIGEQAQGATELVNPLLLCQEIEKNLDEHSVIIADGGDFVGTASYIVRPREALSWLDPGPFGTLGVGAGFALGAKLCRPDSEVWLLYGDGSSGYSLIEFDTFVRHRIPIIAVIGNDACWGQIAREQVARLHDDVGTNLAHTHYEEVARALGGEGILLRDPREIGPAIAKAKEWARQGKPVLINALIGKSDFRKGSISL